MCVADARSKGERIFIAEPLIALAEQIYTRIGGEDTCMITGPSRKGSETADVVVCTFEVLARIAASEPQRLDGRRPLPVALVAPELEQRALEAADLGELAIFHMRPH
jgi:hypothetical protein